ncbi:MAG: WYL domain-containing protein [Melioribacteraceae bacterium]|nr:WYL domain-containing protein [Melioribacteraceae bacterium]
MVHSQDFLRQIEILSSVLNGEMKSKADYAELYSVTEITINRDISALRKLGIQINSKKKCLVLFATPPVDTLVSLCSDYLPLKLNSSSFKDQIELISKINQDMFFQNLTLVCKSVSDSLYLKIDYKKRDGEINSYLLKPIRLLLKDKNWQLFAVKEGETVIKTFLLTRIQSIKQLDKKFEILVNKSDSKNDVDIMLEFNPSVEHEIYDKIWFDNYTLDKAKNGKIILKTKQPITSSLAGWCISWWDTMKIVKPVALKIYCEEMITEYLKTNR